MILGVGFLGYKKYPNVQKQVAYYMENDFSQENIYTDIDALSERLDNEILNGAESFVVYIKGIDLKKIHEINSSLNGIFGSGESYQQLGVVASEYTKIEIKVKRTTNYYVLQAYKNNTPIPKEEKKAKLLYNVVKTVLDQYITDDMTDYEKELVLHDYLVKTCKYSKDIHQSPDNDIYRAYGALVNKDAVCNGYAEALHLLFQCAGISSKFVSGTANGIDHAWNLVKIDEKWYHVDATWNDPMPDSGDKVIHPYFNVTDDIISKSHVWEKDKYPKSYVMDYNYYKVTNTYYNDFFTYKDAAYHVLVHEGKKRYEAVVENYVEKQSDMQFIFENNKRYNNVSWQTYKEGKYCVLVLEAE